MNNYTVSTRILSWSKGWIHANLFNKPKYMAIATSKKGGQEEFHMNQSTGTEAFTF